MKRTELVPGDVILTAAGKSFIHTQIFSGKETFGYGILHAVNDTRPDGPRKLMATSLPGGSDLAVFRCRKPKLAAAAVELARKWAQYETPFDELRSQLKSAWHTGMALNNVTDLRKEMETHFRRQGAFRALKFATRRNRPLCHPGEDEEAMNGPGLTCTMFVIICFQAAGLAPFVKSMDEHPLWRVSDRKMTSSDLDVLQRSMREAGFSPKDFAGYRDYVQLLKSGNPYEIGWSELQRDPPERKKEKNHGRGYVYLPSIIFWKYPQLPFSDFDFGEVFTKGMMLDSKLASPQDLAVSLRDDDSGWEPLGLLEGDTTGPTKQQKESYKQALARNAAVGLEKRQRIMAEVAKERGGWFWWWLTGR